MTAEARTILAREVRRSCKGNWPKRFTRMKKSTRTLNVAARDVANASPPCPIVLMRRRPPAVLTMTAPMATQSGVFVSLIEKNPWVTTLSPEKAHKPAVYQSKAYAVSWVSTHVKRPR